MSDLYETKYGVFNHVGMSSIRPLSTVAMHLPEDYLDGDIGEQYYRLYLDKRIKEHFGLTIDEYLDRPRHAIEMMNRVADEENKRHSSAASSVEAQFKKLQQSV